MNEIQKTLEGEVEGFKAKQAGKFHCYRHTPCIITSLNADNQKLIGQRSQLHQQISENQMVEKELKLLEVLPHTAGPPRSFLIVTMLHLQEDAAVFKLVGPVLIPQDLIEAKANVAKRLEYMTGETCVHLLIIFCT